MPPHTTTESIGEFHLNLIDNAITLIVQCAKNGWMPDDLRHEFGNRINPLISRAFPAIAQIPTREIWVYWATASNHSRVEMPSLAELKEISYRLRHLPSLQEWHILVDLNVRSAGITDTDSSNVKQGKARERVRKLLKKAESTSFEEEASALILKAETLRQQYRIETILHDLSAEDEGVFSNVISARVRLKSPWVRHQLRLLSNIARANSCEAVLLTKSGIATVIGSEDDALHVIDLFASINRQRDFFMRSSIGAQQAAAFGETSSYRRSFMIAYADRIGDILSMAKNHATTERNSSSNSNRLKPELVERSRRTAQATESLFPNARAISLSTRNIEGLRDGYQAAEHSHLSGDSSGLSGFRALSPGQEKLKFPA